MKVSIEQLQPNENNPRLIKDDKFQKLCKSIQNFPQMLKLRPIVVDEDYTILGGNMRYRALQHLGHTEVEVTIADGLTIEQRQEFVIKDNAGFGEWDWDVLANEWSDLPLNDWGIDLPEDWLKEPEQLPEEGEFNGEPPSDPVTVLGDLYELNEHRLHCADSTDSDAVAKLMDGKKADMVFTDPPYNTKMAQGRTSSNWGIIENDDMPDDEFAIFCKDFVNTAYLFTKADGHKYFCMGWSAYNLLYEAMPKVKNCIVWVKNNFGLGHNYRPQHEFILYDGGVLEANDESNVWFEKKDSASSYDHPTQKPVSIPIRAMKNSSKTNDLVLDSFLGSGTTLIACQQTHRTCYGQELDPKYCDVIINRWLTYMRTNNLPYTIKRNGVLLTESELNGFTTVKQSSDEVHSGNS